MSKFIFLLLIVTSTIGKAQIPVVSKGKMVYHKFNNSSFIDQREIAIWLPEEYNS